MAQRCKNFIAMSIASAGLLAMSGCTLIPGGHFEGITSGEKTASLEQELSTVNIQIIDSEVINNQKSKNRVERISSVSGLDVSDYEYRLGVGDVITIGVWDHPELTIPAAVQRTAEFDGFRVQADGTITYAYAPKVLAAGKTVVELREELVNRLSRVIEDPQIDVKVVGFKSQKVYVTGEVKSPGVYPVTETPLTLIDAINQAGGLNERADWKTVTFSRTDKVEHIQLDDFYSKGDISQNRILKHGDVIHVARNDKRNVYVMGDVNKVGTVEVKRYGLSLAEALSEVGGINERSANANGIFVLRKRNFDTDGVVADVYQLRANNIAALIFAEQFELEPQDIVYVTSAPIARWNKVISLLLPSLSTVDALQDIDNQ
ncbi:polysaccharide export protein [Pseudoalteromonas luteoviolacea]|uniref:Polysaccharide biosynthesis protein n=1 Tax=Pseudoalteromonas luteoviolacea H33 TaxID=1365251 RepID=A0A167EYY4_9GAMM|nr:polysaccharide export protein [Pseudoalteromonas luteoviolacea]KZN51382.1 polysaccharide biosynthesis protein [Pseudoalteromonas luteoviolacea H33]KZN71447.1 polysaccharide biosynthesis protein [Pseudoalteromonas luteoviolacea H33-S]MBQ4876803.1 polysaccharide biosynthesis/export family protein [Pseudoalteromonas luteoviolacea]MBQ4905408.1 polysaccharide biosynthesis/export family protein [Pseudoalteromonas luteoviolacea]